MSSSPAHVQSQSGNRFSSASSSPQSNNQDWVCIKCNNLNFSFRKKCNRCKVQSREDNQQVVYADYYYYNQFYSYDSPPQTPEHAQPVRTHIEDAATPNSKATRSQGDIRETHDELPSVSPLVKKYGKGSSSKSDSGLFDWKLYGEDSWNPSELPMLTDPVIHKDESLTDDDEPSAEFIKSVELMII